MPGLYNKYIKLTHSLGDLAALSISNVAAYVAVNGATSGFLSAGHHMFLLYSVLAWIICNLLLGTYKYYKVGRRLWVIFDVFKVFLLYVLLIEATLNIIDHLAFPRSYLLFHYLFLSLIVLSWRIAVTYIIRFLRRRGYNSRKVIIVGYSKTGKELRDFFYNHPEYGYRFEGFFDDNATGERQVIGRIEDVERYVLKHEVNEVYCAAFALKKEQIVSLMQFSDNNLVRMKFLPEPGSFSYQKLKIDFSDLLPILVARSIPLDDAINKLLKRTFDIAFSLFVIIFLLSWLLPILAIIIKLDSKGPVFFGQVRSGINNKTFLCWKLRSMYINTEANSQLARRGDSRITPVGAFLRKTSLDELPQFFNVLMGQMSIVGPRPHMLKADQEYALIAEKYMVRHFIKPGVTGLSQVRGYRGDTTADYQVRGRVKLDIFYLENWTFLLDIKIIFYTIYNAIRGDKAAF
ncbi:undecaprenyl-phosphate glucose phosphotransferase [Pontibacter diazotrophicus]|uniref:Undecaprenyl-phosphate glucose phosphotransferase n=1 Tax=Pontibacter diazotrophicus TaxID=1400979 RepID=A0A3D8LGC3_9BACT|nr:undecaprenyl-phosphate glucose phosphotransferase [Pontibacter diazotrophicus]RDV16455.1 undecaprenyl-phosphate glucose phosphotransferase [Pontibacter diazotrophicus]